LKSNHRPHWKILPPAPEEYSRTISLPSLVAQLLYNRGLTEDEAQCFFTEPCILEDDPFLLTDMSKAVDRIYKAIHSGEKIAIYGDFDVDGITATLVLMEGLSWLGGNVTPYIPNRLREGHGQLLALEDLHKQGISLVITVDCGITAISEAKSAQKAGLDLIITDHHTPLATLPQAIAVIDAKRNNSKYPFHELAGVGVAFKLLQALYKNDDRKERLTTLLDLVALGSVADMVPLIDENRHLVIEGLKILNHTKRIGLKELIRMSRLEPGKLDAKSISWFLGPRINAASRLGDAIISYKLLTTNSLKEAVLLAAELEETNNERQSLTRDTLALVKEKLAGKKDLPLLMEGDESYSIGVIGLVAGKLVDEFHKPAIVVSIGPDACHGSARSIPEFNLTTALGQCQDLLITFGGHPLAAGFTVSHQNLAQLENKLTKIAIDKLSQLDIRPVLNIEAEIPFSTLSSDTIKAIRQLEPFGQGNPHPIFLTKNTKVKKCYKFGNSNNYLKFELQQGNASWQAVSFHSHMKQAEIPDYIDIVYNLEKRRWKGEEILQLNLIDFVPSD
jgi:single-stranded-DNA-specific exonuclease